MSLLLNVGNVKFKSIHKVSNVFKHNYEHFILLNVSKDIVYLSEIIYEQKKSTYKILAQLNSVKMMMNFFIRKFYIIFVVIEI